MMLMRLKQLLEALQAVTKHMMMLIQNQEFLLLLTFLPKILLWMNLLNLAALPNLLRLSIFRWSLLKS